MITRDALLVTSSRRGLAASRWHVTVSRYIPLPPCRAYWWRHGAGVGCSHTRVSPLTPRGNSRDGAMPGNDDHNLLNTWSFKSATYL
jgi:hypothetical protein